MLKEIIEFLTYTDPNVHTAIIPLIGAGVSLLGNILPRLIGQGRRGERLRAAEQTFQVPGQFDEATNIARFQVNQPDPFAAERQRQIEQQTANVTGRVQGTTGSVQEILNSLQGINQTRQTQTAQNLAQQSAFRFNARNLLSNALRQRGQVGLRVDQLNQEQILSEARLQEQELQGIAGGGANVGSDLVSALLLAQGGIGGFGGGQNEGG